MPDIDLELAAARMFGSTAPTRPAPASAPAPAPEAEMAERLFGGPDDTRRSTRGERPGDDDAIARRLFDAPIHGDAERTIAQALAEVDLLSPEDAASEAQQYAPMFDAAGLNATESKLVAAVAVAVATRPPDPQTVAMWVEESKAVLQRDFGPRAGAALADAQRLIAGIPEARDLLLSTGLGDHPAFVALAAKKAAELKRLGRLQ